MTITHKKAAAAMLALALTVAPLAACGGQTSQGGGTDSSTTTQSQTATLDVSSWKTLGDALAYDTGENNTAGWDEKHYIAVFNAGNTVVRVVAKMDTETHDKLDALDATQKDYNEKFMEVMGGLELESAEDLGNQKISQAELDTYVGKTGQDLVDDGFTFEIYWMYGDDQTTATFAKGYLAYNATFNVAVSDDQTDDNGASVMGATIMSMEYAGASQQATDPTAL